MAPPIIDSIFATPATVQPGQAFVVTIVGHDPDQQSRVLEGTLRDDAGNTAQATVVVPVSDPLTFELRDVDNVGFQITPRLGQPGVFDVVAP